jgi:hypothetical protein
MMYQEEFSRLKKIYEGMPAAKREMIGPILALPLVAMGIFGFVLLPFSFGSIVAVVCIGALAAAISAFMILKMVDLRDEIAAWRKASKAHPPKPGEAAFRMLAASNDPGHLDEAQEPAKKARIGA